MIIVIVLVSTLTSTMSNYDQTCGITILMNVFLEKNKNLNLRDLGAKFRWSRGEGGWLAQSLHLIILSKSYSEFEIRAYVNL